MYTSAIALSSNSRILILLRRMLTEDCAMHCHSYLQRLLSLIAHLLSVSRYLYYSVLYPSEAVECKSGPPARNMSYHIKPEIQNIVTQKANKLAPLEP